MIAFESSIALRSAAGILALALARGGHRDSSQGPGSRNDG
jgi:hypothetical protein